MPRYVMRAGAWLLIASVLFASNLHLPVVQMVAWSRMYSHYREGYSPMQAIEITLSGKVPCDLCQFVKAAQKEKQQTQGSMSFDTRHLLPLPAAAEIVCAPAPSVFARVPLAAALAAFTGAPEPPPPKFA